jgi:hypothetical protein
MQALKLGPVALSCLTFIKIQLLKEKKLLRRSEGLTLFGSRNVYVKAAKQNIGSWCCVEAGNEEVEEGGINCFLTPACTERYCSYSKTNWILAPCVVDFG